MLSVGGMTGTVTGHASHVWPSTIYLFLVCCDSFLHHPRYSWLHVLATSVYVEQIFSKGRIVLSHLHNWLSVGSTHALLCVGNWSLLGLVKKEDINTAMLLDVEEEDESDQDVQPGWDMIE